MLSRLAIVIFSGVAATFAQTGSIYRKDPIVDYLVPTIATVEKVADGFGFIEGPLWLRDGSLIFSDIPNNTILRWTKDGRISEFLKQSGYDGKDAPAGAFVGSNGLTMDYRGRVIICQQGNRQVVRRELDGNLTVLADRYEGKRLNSPNDVVLKADGSLYFTDPPYGLPEQDKDPRKELPFNGVFRLKDGKLTLLIKDLSRPNGIAFSPDEKVLYVANSDPARKIWMRYDVKADGTLGAGIVFYDVTNEKAQGVPDGLKLDKAGNLYATGPGGVWIISSAGKHLGTITPPEIPANLHWGDPDAKTLYMTARKGLYRVRLSATGLRP